MKNRILFVLFLVAVMGCNYHKESPAEQWTGFWEGPHPDNINKKFYVFISAENDTMQAKGFWTENGFYSSQFSVDSLKLTADSLRFFIPDWGCFYAGQLSEAGHISGGFTCQGEPFDSVALVKNDSVATYLTEAKPNCKSADYAYSYQYPPDLDDKIPVARSLQAADSMFIFSLLPEIVRGDYGRINSFLLLKNDTLLCEEYFYGYSRNDLHQIESVTKSITSLLIGIAHDQQLITRFDEPLYRLFPSYSNLQDSVYEDITIENLLTMQSGFETREEELFRSGNRIDFALQRPLNNPPGSVFNYDGGNTEILGAILTKKTGMYADAFAGKYLFEPLGIRHYNWEVLKEENYPCMGGALQMLPRDMAKIGMLVLRNGNFDGRSVVSDEWIKRSTSTKTTTHIEGDDYAYQWWVIRLGNGTEKYHTIWGNGFGSQFIYIIPELQVVIATTGHNYEYDSWAITEGISRYIALLDSGKQM